MAEHESHDVSVDPEIESRLRSARPRPDIDFVNRVEGKLFKPRSRRALISWRPAFAAGFAALALAALTIAFDLAGIGPFSDNAPVQAGNDCHTVVVSKREKQPVTTSGQPGVKFEYRTVKRHVQRCR